MYPMPKPPLVNPFLWDYMERNRRRAYEAQQSYIRRLNEEKGKEGGFLRKSQLFLVDTNSNTTTF